MGKIHFPDAAAAFFFIKATLRLRASCLHLLAGYPVLACGAVPGPSVVAGRIDPVVPCRVDLLGLADLAENHLHSVHDHPFLYSPFFWGCLKVWCGTCNLSCP